MIYMGENSALSQRKWTNLEECLLRKEPWEIKQSSSDFVSHKQTWNASSVPDLDQNSDSDQEVLVLNPGASNCDNSLPSLEQKDFNYSQKLFHIADGNLYSIFSPIQGRSYGMKPSFLRKQKYTVQECHGRGRKNSRKGLKFHNFLPSESVTSEKGGGSNNAKWKVYSECRLREEHGTKQISISNWSKSVPKAINKISPFGEATSGTSTNSTVGSESMIQVQNNHLEELETKSAVCLNANFKLNSFCFNEEQTISLSNQKSNEKPFHKKLSSHASKTNSLDILLNSLSKKNQTSTLEKNSNSDESDSQIKNAQKHRRKPIQTRRIVPYKKYLSIVEENKILPLDLSSKCLIEKPSSQPSPQVDDNQLSHSTYDLSILQPGSSPPLGGRPLEYTSNFRSDNRDFSHLLLSKDFVNSVSPKNESPSQQSPQVDVLYPFPIGKNLHLSNQNLLIPPPPPLIGLNSSEMFDSHQLRSQQAAERFPNDANPFFLSPQFSIQKSVVKEVQSRPRRRNQRSAMKQKLEDTFRQNGFLVKTKQVSDGEATFCKFRQLRKCTRYYLKSLEQHLPDEFHKMLKGFLPPKTVLPPVLGASSPSSETGM